MEAENPIGPRHRRSQSGLHQPLKIDGKIKARRAEFAPASQPGPRIAALENGDAVDVWVALQQRRPLRLNEPSEVRARKAVFERGHGRQCVDHVTHGAEPDYEDART